MQRRAPRPQGGEITAEPARRAAARIVRRATDAPITIAGRGVVRTHPGGCVERWELVGPGLAQIGAPCR